MRRAGRVALLALGLAALPAASAPAAPQLVQVGTFDRPVFVTAAPLDVRHAYVVERRGTIAVVRDGTQLSEPFLDIRSRVQSSDAEGDERGLLGLAFAPDFAASGNFYVYYASRAVAGVRTGDLVVEAYRTDPADPVRAAAEPVRRVLVVPHSERANHNGGTVAFGPDGMLWLAPGDGGGGGDPDDNGQNPQSLLGKLLRIGPTPGAGCSGGCTIPADNPFAQGGGRPEAWATGLRNPYRFAFDRVDKHLVIADVGQGMAEEIDFARHPELGRGANYGWDRLEGSYRFDDPPQASWSSLTRATPADEPPGYSRPVFEHLHDAGWCSVTGGTVVRDPELPSLKGRYVYGDFCLGVIHAGTVADATPATAPVEGRLKVDGLSGFGEDGCGRVYATSIQGPVFRIAESGRCAGPAPTPFAVPGQAQPPGQGTPPPAQTSPPKLTLTLRASSRQRVLRAGGVVRATVSCSAQCRVGLTARPYVRRRGGRRVGLQKDNVVRTLAAGARVSLPVRLRAKSRRSLARARRMRGSELTVLLTAGATGAGGRDDERTTVRVSG